MQSKSSTKSGSGCWTLRFQVFWRHFTLSEEEQVGRQIFRHDQEAHVKPTEKFAEFGVCVLFRPSVSWGRRFFPWITTKWAPMSCKWSYAPSPILPGPLAIGVPHLASIWSRLWGAVTGCTTRMACWKRWSRSTYRWRDICPGHGPQVGQWHQQASHPESEVKRWCLRLCKSWRSNDICQRNVNFPNFLQILEVGRIALRSNSGKWRFFFRDALTENGTILGGE